MAHPVGESLEGPLRVDVDRRAKLVKIGATVVQHGRYVTFQLAELAVPRRLFADILKRIDRQRPRPVPT